MSKNRKGVYNANTDTITISKSKLTTEAIFQQVVLHELYHAATVKNLLSLFENQKETIDFLKQPFKTIDVAEINFKEGTPEYAKKFLIDLIKLRNDSIVKLTKKHGLSAKDLAKQIRFSGLENPFEFISEAMTNPDFMSEIQSLQGNQNILQRIYNSIVEFLNSVFKTNLKPIEINNLKTAVNLIKNYINTNSAVVFTEIDYGMSGENFNFKSLGEFDNKFTALEIAEITNTFQGYIANVIQGVEVENLEKFLNSENTVRGKIYDSLYEYVTTKCPESCKTKSTDVLNYFEQFYSKAVKSLMSNNILDVSEGSDFKSILLENEEVQKNFDDSAVKRVSMNDTITRQIKLFFKSCPELKSNAVKFTQDNKPIWDYANSTTTGLPTFVDFAKVYPYAVRNLTGATTLKEIIERLEKMSEVYPS
ncbi:MAG TPA: hypothetical protein PKI46_08085, partial [Bacteroidales bacterium]|nr:hypothetical protein [Bacteroidales bacterium]